MHMNENDEMMMQDYDWHQNTGDLGDFFDDDSDDDYNDGYNVGYDDGYEVGYDDGYNKGYADGRKANSNAHK